MSKRKSIFFLVVDDGGLPTVSNEKIEVPFPSYLNLLQIAKRFEVKIPLACSMKYLDINNVSGEGSPVKYAEKLITLLKNNNEYLELADHGFSHRLNDSWSEFFDPVRHIRVPEEEQEAKIYNNMLIYKDLGFSFPDIVVPPCNYWEEGVTDRLYSKYGAKYLIGTRNYWQNIDHNKWKLLANFFVPTYSWKDSPYILFLPRIWSGLESKDIELDDTLFKRIKRRIFNNIVFNFVENRTFYVHNHHSHMVHITNFIDERAFVWWSKIFEMCSNDKRIYSAKSNIDAVKYFQGIR